MSQTTMMKRELTTVIFASDHCQKGKADGPDTAAAIARGLWNDLWDWDREHFVVLILNVRGVVVGFKLIAIGTLTTCLVHPREVFRSAIEMNAASIIVAHNHPSGDIEPSEEDFTLFERLKQAGQILAIPVFDSLVLSPLGYRSMEETKSS